MFFIKHGNVPMHIWQYRNNLTISQTLGPTVNIIIRENDGEKFLFAETGSHIGKDTFISESFFKLSENKSIKKLVI